MENLHNFYFHYNEYTNEWNAFLRNEANSYMNEAAKDFTVFTNTDINELIKMINSLETREKL